MSGDVQPRKRKDKKKKKDDLGLVEEPRGTSVPLGEGDLFLHSHHDHGTGGHWCAKVIFFSLLAVLVTLIGLIILENRGLSELESQAVHTQYSGVLDGWLEDAPDDDHHDEHTLELKHHDDDEDEDHGVDESEDDHLGDNSEEDNTDEENDDEVNSGNEDIDDSYENADTDLNNLNEQSLSDEQDNEEEDDLDNDESFMSKYGYLFSGLDEAENTQPDLNSDEQEIEETVENKIEYAENTGNRKELYDQLDDEEEDKEEFYSHNQHEDDHDDEHGDDDDDEDDNTEIEPIEKEADDEEPVSLDLPVLPEDDDDDDESEQNDDDDDDDDGEDDDFLEQDDLDEVAPIVERITAPSGKPFDEIEEDSSERPPDTLAEEEEYERRQEQLRKEQEEASHVWLKVVVGGALLAATHAVLRRAAAPRDEAENVEEIAEEPTLTDRRLTLTSEQVPTPPAPKKPDLPPQRSPIQEEIMKQIPSIIQSAPTPSQRSIEEDFEEQEENETSEKELYSDEEIDEEEPEIVENEMEVEPNPNKSNTPEVDDNAEIPDDVEIIEEEDIDEELEDEEEDEEISDVDDAELLSRLEAKYGRLPEGEKPKQKDGGNSIDDDWPGEPNDPFWKQELDKAEREVQQGSYMRAVERVSMSELAGSARARWIAAKAYDGLAEVKQDNALLGRAITAYLHVLKMNERLSDKKLLEIAERTLDRIQFRGTYLAAEPVYRLLVRRFPSDPTYRNKWSICYLMANRNDLAEEVLKETLELWPDDRVALAHYAFVIKSKSNDRLEEAVALFYKALDGDSGPANEPRFYYHLGDALLLLGRHEEAHEVHKRAAALGHFLSPSQRSLYNVKRLKSRPWWNVEETPYAGLAKSLENSWRDILKEGEAARALYMEEKEGLRSRGEWSQLDLFVRGREVEGRCSRAPVTCAVVRKGLGGGGCRRGQVKFSLLEPGTHVRPHVGPTNCRLRMHLALSNTTDTYLRVDRETRQWQVGKTLLFDDSFEHEVWHNGTGSRLVLIVDVWHPDLTPAERRSLPAI